MHTPKAKYQKRKSLLWETNQKPKIQFQQVNMQGGPKKMQEKYTIKANVNKLLQEFVENDDT